MPSPSPRSESRFRPIVTIAVVAVWLVLVGFLLRDYYFPAVAGISQSVPISAVESDDWFVIRIRGAYAGFGRSRQFRQGDHWVVHDNLHISLNIQGRLKPIIIDSSAKVDDDFRLISFDVKVASGIISFQQKGRVDGNYLLLTIPKSQGGGTKRLRIHEAPRISRSLGLPLPLTGLKVGDTFRVPVFDPMDGQEWDARITVREKAEIELSGKKRDAWLVHAEFRAVEATMWVDKQGQLLKGRLPLGITVVRADKGEISGQVKGSRTLPEMMTLASVPVKGSIPHPRKLELLRLKFLGGRGLNLPSDHFRQKATDSEITVTRESLPKATYAIPYQDRKMQEYLAPSRFIRSDHPKIIQKAREIIGDEKDPVKAASLINRWVFDNIKKVPTPAVPDAYTILETRQGDCNEHAVLAVALARAVGIPARIALGLVNMDEGFYYHAWAAYWAGDTWFTGDPLMDQVPADATHVTLLYGDVDKHMNVLTYLGKLKLEVLEAK
ncbi:MAG: transglutaminase-like domain-containing protein [Deltaproteobacteria bacterium]